MVELYVEPADGYEFVEWNIQNGAIPNSSNQTYRFRMPRDAFIIEPIVKKKVEEEKITPKVDIPQTEINFENIAINLEMYAQVEPKGQNVNWSREIVYAFQDEMMHYTVFSIKNKTGQNTTIRSTTPGIARLIASIVVNGKEYVDDCLIMVPGVRITSPDVYESFSGRSESIFVGDTVQLTAEVVPQDSAVIWSSSDTNVATVDRNGKVTAVSEGFCTIKAEINYNGKSYSGFLSIYVFED